MKEATKHLKSASAAAAAAHHLDPEISRNLGALGLDAGERNGPTIKAAFRSLAFKYHPDSTVLAKKEAEALFVKARTAFERLRTKLAL